MNKKGGGEVEGEEKEQKKEKEKEMDAVQAQKILDFEEAVI